MCARQKSHALAAIALFGHTKIQRAQSQPPKTECGYPNGRIIENGHTKIVSRKTGVLPEECNFKKKKKLVTHTNYRRTIVKVSDQIGHTRIYITNSVCAAKVG